MASVLTEIKLPFKLFSRGKVRNTFEYGDSLLMVASDRLSAFDVVLPDGIPSKGAVLTQLSAFWFNYTKNIIPNHMITAEFTEFPSELQEFETLNGRAMLVQKTKPIKVECVVRGYLSGSAWKSYKNGKTVCGIKLKPGLLESEKLDEPLFTPTTKAEVGHDLEMSAQQMRELLGADVAGELTESSFKIYEAASKKAEARGIIIADTKFEFGFLGKEIIFIDEALTPDSSRFWPMDGYEPGKPQKSFDKQFARDYLERIGWNKQPPAPKLPNDIIEGTSKKYIEAYERLTEKKFRW